MRHPATASSDIGPAPVSEVDGVARTRTLPPSAFTDASFLRRELDTVFRDAWLLVPPGSSSAPGEDARSVADLVRRRGARAPATLQGKPVFAWRDFDGELRLFPNVCTHAWHTLCAGPDRERTLTCPQHGRKFDDAGRCTSQPGFEGVAGFPDASDDLRSLPVHEWGDLLFASLGRPPPAGDVFRPVRESLGRLPFERLVRRPASGEMREVAGNWKQHAWNYLDELHIPFIHRRPGGLADALHLDSYRTELFPHGVLQWAHGKDPAHGFDSALLPDRFRDPQRPDRRVFALWWFVWPNLTLNFYPWGLSVNVFQPVEERPARTLFHWYHWTWDEAAYAERDQTWKLREVDDEDVDALSQVARGVASGLASPGRFAPSEKGPRWFHERVARAVALPGASPHASPDVGS